MLNEQEIEKLKKLSLENRNNIIDMVYNGNSGHIGGSLSACDILTVLFHKCMKHCGENKDRFILSKGHVSPLYYSVLSQIGLIDKKELLTFRKLGSRLQGHPSKYCPGVEVSTGSLGQGLSIASGIAMGLKLDKSPANVFVLMGDGELQEGSVWESFMGAKHRGLNNLIAIIDRNRLQIDGNTEDIKPLDNLGDKLKAFNWNVIEINGHDMNAIYEALEEGKKATQPTAIIAETIKGKGVSFMENNAGWHGKAPSKEQYEQAKAELK